MPVGLAFRGTNSYSQRCGISKPIPQNVPISSSDARHENVARNTLIHASTGLLCYLRSSISISTFQKALMGLQLIVSTYPRGCLRPSRKRQLEVHFFSQPRTKATQVYCPSSRGYGAPTHARCSAVEVELCP